MATDGRRRQEEDREEFQGQIGGQRVKIVVVEEAARQQGGRGKTRLGLWGWSLPIEVTESAVEIALVRNKIVVPGVVALHSSAVVYMGKPEGPQAGDGRMLARQMVHAGQDRTVLKREEEFYCAEISLLY
jgi:hypothetical protein